MVEYLGTIVFTFSAYWFRPYGPHSDQARAGGGWVCRLDSHSKLGSTYGTFFIQKRILLYTHILFLLHWPLNKPVRGFPTSEHLFHRSQNLGTHIPRNFPKIIQFSFSRKIF